MCNKYITILSGVNKLYIVSQEGYLLKSRDSAACLNLNDLIPYNKPVLHALQIN